MAPYDYSSAPPPRDFGELIPDGTIAEVQMRIRKGNAGEDGYLKRSQDGGCEMLDAEFVITSGPFAKRKFWANMILAGTTGGHAQAAEISRGMLRGILQSARGIKSDDTSETARAALIASIKDFDGLGFIARIRIEKGKAKTDGSGDIWPDKNTLAGAVTPDKKEWYAVTQTASPANGAGTPGSNPTPSAPGITKPSWA
jgi:hypothetical protein